MQPLTAFQAGVKANTAVRAKWTVGQGADGKIYDAVVQSVAGDQCLVTFAGYGNSQKVALSDLLEPSAAAPAAAAAAAAAAPKAAATPAAKKDAAAPAAAAAAPVDENVPSPQKEINAFLFTLTSAPAGDSHKVAAKELALFIKNTAGLRAFYKNKILSTFTEAIADKKKTNGARVGQMEFFLALVQNVGQPAEPFLMEILPSVFENLGEKDKAVVSAAESCLTPIKELLAPRPNTAVPLINVIYEAVKMIKWQSKHQALELLISLVASAPIQIAHAMPDIVPILTDLMWDTKQQVADSALACLTACCDIVQNKDLTPFIPALIKALKDPKEVAECIHQLASTTFVQTVSGAALALVAPLLLRGFREHTSIRRQAAKIANNMSKLVDNPSEAAPFLPKLMPAVELASNETSDPEVRDVCTKALAQLERIRLAAETEKKTATSAAIFEELSKHAVANKLEVDEAFNKALTYCSQVLK